MVAAFLLKNWKIILVIIFVIVLVCIGKSQVSKIQHKIAIKQAKQDYENSFIQGSAGGSTYSINANVVATAVYNAMHRDCMFSACEFDTRAVEALLPVPKPFIQSVVDEYSKVSRADGKELLMPADLQNLMDKPNWDKIKYLFS